MFKSSEIRIIVIPAILIFFASLGYPRPSPKAQETDIQAFVSHMKNTYEAQDIQNYLTCFSPDIRDAERKKIDLKFQDLQMESASLHLPSIQKASDDEATVFLRVFFQSDTKVIIEAWRLTAVRTPAGWQITDSSLLGEAKTLYKVILPSEKMMRIKRFEVEHKDIVLTFEDAICFYDNIPDIETALIVVGKGRLEFSPSHPRERHQLELAYKKKFVKDKLNYVYLRFSNYFFQNSIKITEYENKTLPVSPAEVNRAYSVFMKHYARSFTVQNSLNGELLSFLPRGNEAVIEFQGRKLGDTSYIYSPFSEDEINLYQWKKERILNLYSPLQEEGKKRLFISMSQKFDVRNYEIDLNFIPNKHYFSGKAKVDVVSLVGPLDGLKLKLNPNLEVLRIRDMDQRDLYYTQDKLRKTIYIYFLKRPPQGETSTVEIFYRGRIKPPDHITDMVSLGQIETSLRFPLQFETYLYSGSSYWYPAPSDVDYFTAILKLRTPSKYQVVSCGKLTGRFATDQSDQEEEAIGKGSVHIYEINKPVKYLSFIAGNLDLVKEEFEGIPVKLFKSPYSRSGRWDVFGTTKEILEFYEKMFSPFPYEKLHVVKRAWDKSGGHSPASFVVLNELPRMTRQTVQSKIDSPVNLSRWKEYFLAHEVGHQWWGQGLGWKSYRDQWLSEGMAQFGTILFLKHKYGEKAFSQILKNFSDNVKKRSKWGGITMGSRISYFSFDAYQSIVYNKTSLVLNMLKDFLGEEVFFSGIKKFFEQYKFSAASSNSFFQTMQDVAGKDLKPFFDKWFNSHLLPKIRVSFKTQTDTDGYRLHFNVMQIGDMFVFPLWIEWTEEQEKVRKKVVIESKISEFDFKLRKKPRDITVNPDKAVPGEFKVS